MSQLKHMRWMILFALVAVFGAQTTEADLCTLPAACSPELQRAQDASHPRMDADGDGIANAQDACPDQFALDPSGCQIDGYDSDGDGLPDAQDWCPYLSIGGVTSGETGCPGQPTDDDPDGDGVTGDADACPMEPGSALAGGCMDSDGDRFPDNADECPFVAGVANSCPDTDMDGFHDTVDACPLQPAPNSANGCPTPNSGPRQFTRFMTAPHLLVLTGAYS